MQKKKQEKRNYWELAPPFVLCLLIIGFSINAYATFFAFVGSLVIGIITISIYLGVLAFLRRLKPAVSSEVS